MKAKKHIITAYNKISNSLNQERCALHSLNIIIPF